MGEFEYEMSFERFLKNLKMMKFYWRILRLKEMCSKEYDVHCSLNDLD